MGVFINFMTFTVFDFLVFAIMGFFGFLGLFKGFIKELFSIISWVVAALLTIIIRPVIASLIAKKINAPFVADLISNSFLFAFSLIVVSIITSRVADSLGKTVPTSVNAPLGLAIGSIKGYLLASLVFAGLFAIFSDGGDMRERTGPNWFGQSQTYIPLSFGGEALKPLADAFFGNFSSEEVIQYQEEEGDEESPKNKINDMIDKKIDETLERKKEEMKDKLKTNEAASYSEEQMRRMDRLIDSYVN